MTDRFFHDLVWSCQQGAIHELLLKDGITLATWALAVVTGILVLDGWRRGNEQRRRWDREDGQRSLDREEERRRWQRDEQSRRLQWLDTRFNSQGMIVARKRAAAEMLEFKLSRQLGKPTAPVWPVIAFISQAAALCEEGLLDIGEVDLAYRDHVMLIVSVYGKFLSHSFQHDKYDALLWLQDELKKTSSSAFIDEPLTASISFVQQEFLEREATL